ncbi:MAG: enoyl-CoA hydratase/isomerase family protein [Euryarchaeota archaeon]|nr:enoyl-CoA hydratase/isomerase family protein [Euryarchaeota archaeon]
MVVILGAGNMGSGIGQAAAQAGFKVRIRDLAEKDLERGRTAIIKTLDGAIQRGKSTPAKKADILSRIAFTTDLIEALSGARLVVEAVFEEAKVKRPLFEEVVRHVAPDCIVATNTSSLSVAELFEGLPSPGRYAGLHFFYPAAINKLVEVIAGPSTSSEVLETLSRFSYALRKIPIRVEDRAGFCVNRFFVPFLNESVRLLEEGVANLSTIEATANELLGTNLGPFQLMNVTGVTIAFHAMGSLHQAFGEFYAPAKLLESQYQRKESWDLKAGGEVDPSKNEAVRRRLLGAILGIATRLVEESVASPEDTDRGATIGLRWAKGPFALLNGVGPTAALGMVEAVSGRWKEAFPVSKELHRLAGEGAPAWPLSQIRVRKEGALAWVLLDRPEVMNALNTRLLEELEQKVLRAAEDPEVKVLLLAGSSNVFAAGADIAEMAGKSVQEGREFTMLGQRVTRAIETLPKPVIAVVEGYAFGGGLELALSCDFILAAEGTTMGLPEVTLGIHPGFGGTQRMVRLVGRARTKLMVESDLRIRADEAERWGLVARSYPPERLHEEARAIGKKIAANAPIAVRLVREVIDLGSDTDLPTGLRLEGESASYTFSTEDQKEGMRAFQERRPPKFRGR